MFVSKKVICLIYVDDCLWFARNQKDIDAVLQSFHDDGDKFKWEMRVEGTVSEFLVIDITKTSGGRWRLPQDRLINKILKIG